jgi:hypothetical protein
MHVNRICVLSMRKLNVSLHCVVRLQPDLLDALLCRTPFAPARTANPFTGWAFEEGGAAIPLRLSSRLCRELGSQGAYAQLSYGESRYSHSGR